MNNTKKPVSNNAPDNKYKYLSGLLHRVRWAQYFAAILAEALILLAFFASGMDIRLGGTMANIAGVKWAWAAIFSLGVDTSFVISWVRCRQMGKSWHLIWGIPVALGMSFVVFEPVVIQLLQQSLNINFSQALNELGINIVLLVYGRAGVAVLLGAILALTNVENAIEDKRGIQVSTTKRTFLPLQKLMDKYMPEVDTLIGQQNVPTVDTVNTHADVSLPVQSVQEKTVQPKRPIELKAVPGPIERVRQALDTEPGASDRRIAKLSNVSPTTAKKYRLLIEHERNMAV